MDRNQALQQYTGWLYTVARNMTSTHLYDDLVQEGYIAMWRALGTYNPDKGALDYWLKRAAINRMRSVISGETMTTNLERKDTTGFTTERGNETRKKIAAYLVSRPKATITEIASELGMSISAVHYQRKKMPAVITASVMTDRTVSLNALMSSFDTMGSRHHEWVPEALHYIENLDGIEVAYHAGEILRALDVLTPAQRRYVVARFWGGQTPSELRNLFGYDPASLWRDAKPKLQLRLKNLRELVRS